MLNRQNQIIYSLSYEPNDEYYDRQWGNRRMNLEATWDIINESRNVKVAIIDSEIIPNHEDLEANINFIDGKDFVDDDNEPIDEVAAGKLYLLVWRDVIENQIINAEDY